MARNGADFPWDSYTMVDDLYRAPRDFSVCAPVCPEVCSVYCSDSHTFNNCPSNLESIFYVGDQIFMWSGQETNSNFGQVTHESYYPPMFQNQQQQQQHIPQATPIPTSSSLEEFMREYFDRADAMMEMQAESCRNIEVYFGQISNEIRNQGQECFHSDTGNSRDDYENCKAAIPQGGKELEEVRKPVMTGQSSIQEENSDEEGLELVLEKKKIHVEETAETFVDCLASTKFSQNSLEMNQNFLVGKSAEHFVEQSVGNSVSTTLPQELKQSHRTANVAEEFAGNGVHKSSATKLLQNLPKFSIVKKLEKWEESIVECFVVNTFVAKSTENEILLFYDERMYDLFEGDASDEGEHHKFDFVPKEVPKRRVIKWPWVENGGLSRWKGISRNDLHSIG